MAKNILIFEKIASDLVVTQDINNLVKLEECAKEFLNEQNVDGSEVAYFNFAINYAKVGDYPNACKIIEIAMKKFPESISLRALYLRVVTEIGDDTKAKELCNEILQHIHSLPKEYWSKQVFVYVIEYYRTLLKRETREDVREKYRTNIDMLLCDFRTHFPSLEDSYLIESEIYRKSKPSKERTLLLSAIENSSTCIWSAIRLAELHYEQHEYKKALQYLSKHCMSVAYDDTNKSHEAYVYYLSAMCKSNQILKSRFCWSLKKRELRVKSIYKEFELALKPQMLLSFSAKQNAEKQICILEVLTGVKSGLAIQ